MDGYGKKTLMIKKLIGETSINWIQNKYSLALLFCFMVYNLD
jgi:hypothetical protein